MDPLAAAQSHLDAMATGDLAGARAVLHPDNVNHMAADEPPAASQPGLAGFMATSAWLRYAFSDLAFEIIEGTSDPTRTVAHVWFRGRQTGPFVVFPPGGAPVSFPAKDREFAVRQAHVFRLIDGLHAEHIAVRDDLGMMTQLGHLPPSPASLAHMVRWKMSGGAKRSIAHVKNVADDAAAATISI